MDGRMDYFDDRTKHHQFSSNCTHQTEEITSFTDSTEIYSESLSLSVRDDGKIQPLVETVSVDDDVDLVSKASTLSRSFPQERLPNGVPSEITVINEEASQNLEGMDIVTRLQVAECTVSSYKEALNSTELVVESLQHSLRDSRMNAERLSEERDSLLSTIRDMEETESEESCQFSFIKVLVCFGLFFHL
jgi:hypothetical protein